MVFIIILLGNTSITCNKRAACPEETVKCTCITGYSNTLAWTSDQLIGPNNARLEFVSIDPILTTHRVPGSSTFAVLTDVSSPNDVVVLSSDLTFTASDSPAHILTCLNVGRQSSYSIIIPKSSEWSVLWVNYGWYWQLKFVFARGTNTLSRKERFQKTPHIACNKSPEY